LFAVHTWCFIASLHSAFAMKRAPPNHVALSEPPRSKKIRIGDSLDTEAADNVKEDLADEKTSSPYENAGQGSKRVGRSGQDEQWTRVERRKQKKAKKLGHKADVCVFLLDFLYFRGSGQGTVAVWNGGCCAQLCDVI
jgi:hypothetical protein